MVARQKQLDSEKRTVGKATKEIVSTGNLPVESIGSKVGSTGSRIESTGSQTEPREQVESIGSKVESTGSNVKSNSR